VAPSFRLFTLGPPQLLTATGEQVRFRTRKHFALLARLALEAGHRFTRDYLMDLLWPDTPARLGRHSLAQGISVLKAKLGRDSVQIQKATVALAEGAVDVDAHHLDDSQAEIQGRFLDGFEVPRARPFEDWKDQWAAKLQPRLRDCLVKQMDRGRRVGDYATVERHAQVLYDLDPLLEDAVRGLMEARAWVGDRTDALKIFGRYEERLAEELGAKPSADLARMADLLREGKRSPTRPPAPGEPLTMQRRFEPEMLIGREREFSVLRDAWLEVRQRQPRVMVITGDPGLGKTTLTNTFAASCQMEGAVVARAQAYDAERDLPFAVLAELVKQLVQQRAIGGADPEALGEMTRICAEVAQAYPGVPRPVEWAPEVVPLRLADAFLKTVTAAAEESPVVLVVDDLHAADNATAGILHVLVRKLVGTRVILVLTTRPSELRVTVAQAALAGDTTIEGLREVELDPLDATEGRDLISRLVADDPREVPVQRILDVCRGNPLALDLVTREWRTHDQGSLLEAIESIDTQPQLAIAIPLAIGRAFEQQLRLLDVENRSCLGLAALLGRRLSDLSLYKACGLGVAQAGNSLGRLRDAGLLRDTRGDLEFRNELMRAQAYYSVVTPVRQQLHQQVARFLQARSTKGSEDLSSEIAWHYFRGGNKELALKHAIVGARAALNVGAPCEAERLLSHLLRESTDKHNTKEGRLLLAEALFEQSKAWLAKQILDSLLSDNTLSVTLRANASVLLAKATRFLDAGDALYCTAADDAYADAQKARDKGLVAQAALELARSGAESGDLSRVNTARNALQQLSDSSTASRDPDLLCALGFCDFYAGEIRKAKEVLNLAVSLLNSSGRLVQMSQALTSLGAAQMLLCEFPEAEESFLSARAIALRIGDDSRASLLSQNLSSNALLRGSCASAVSYGEDSVHHARKAFNHPYSTTSHTVLAEAYAFNGDRLRALQNLDQAREAMVRRHSWQTQVEFYLVSCLVGLVMGNESMALASAEAAELAAAGREHAVWEKGMYLKVKVLWKTKVHGPESAMSIVQESKREFKHRLPLYYLDALAVGAWLERQLHGCYGQDTEEELRVLYQPQLHGKRGVLIAQGFIDEKCFPNSFVETRQ